MKVESFERIINTKLIVATLDGSEEVHVEIWTNSIVMRTKKYPQAKVNISQALNNLTAISNVLKIIVPNIYDHEVDTVTNFLADLI